MFKRKNFDLLDELSCMDHTIVHFEIPVSDIEKTRKFYMNVFGWKIERAPGPVEYWLVQTVPVDEKGMTLRPGVNGGMYKKERAEQKQVNYFAVESVDEYMKKITAAGGRIVTPKQEVMDVGWIAVAADPEGNMFAILQPTRM
jgi:predicted enzyme related to lactoylglutathione lyase